MKPTTIYTGTYGIELEFKVEGISLGDSLKLKVRNPNNSRSEIDLGLAFPSSVENGIVKYNIEKHTFSLPGEYKLQVFVENADRKFAVTGIETLKVRASLEFKEK